MNSQTTLKPVKIPFDSLTLRAVVMELRALLTGGQVQDVRQPAPTELLLGIRAQGRNYLLALSDDAQFARVHLTTTRRANAPTPPTFCMALRKHIENGVLRAIRQRGFDRIFEMEIERTTETGERTACTLIAELMGKHSNLILVNESGVIVDAAKRVTRRVNRVRETLPGLPYRSPPEQEGRIDPFAPGAADRLAAELAPDRTPDALAERLLAHYAGMSPFLAREIALRVQALAPGISAGPLPGTEAGERQAERPSREALQAAWEAIFKAAAEGAFAPVLLQDADNHPVGAYPFPVAQWPAERQTALLPDLSPTLSRRIAPARLASRQEREGDRTGALNGALDRAFTFALERAGYEAVAGELRGRIERELKRWERQCQSIEKTLREADRAEEYKQTGELLLANLWRVQSGDASVTVQDYYDPAFPDRVIPLDPKLSVQDNAEAWFRRYRKARDGQEAAREQQARVEAALQTLTEARTRLDTREETGTETTLRSFRNDLLASGLLRHAEEGGETAERERSGPDFQGHRIRRFTTPEGYEIYLGETATANDFLTTRVAAPGDIWLHVRAATSAHVIIRAHGRPETVPRSVLEYAALLCARHSSQKHSSLVPVDYTLKKYVRKPRGAAPGSADYRQETTLHVTP
jgi:predicted ribosome quality control (RQC) complex YloA/Tae2 family protein